MLSQSELLLLSLTLQASIIPTPDNVPLMTEDVRKYLEGLDAE